jgi:ATP-binding cassette subfamily B protein
MFEFNQIYRRLESSMTEAAQFTELLLKPPTVLDPASPEPLRSRAADVRFEHVTFAHAGAEPLFEGLDLAVPSGSKIGLVGRSGGGKTTLTRLLLRMTDINAGRILIGGQDISRLRQADLRSLIAYVPQDPAMFHRSLRDNIAFARPDATDAEIRRAAEAAHVTEFADALTASTPWWASAASSCPADSASGSPWPGRSCVTRRSCCSTRRPAPWTPRARFSSRRRCGGSWKGAPPWWWRTG